MVYSTALLERSWLEFERRKTADRAMLQMQALIDQHSTKLTITQSTYKSIEESAPAQDRLRYICSVAYLSHFELKRDLAFKYLQCQVFASALNYFRELELWDEVVTCYQLMQKPQRAELGETLILCVYCCLIIHPVDVCCGCYSCAGAFETRRNAVHADCTSRFVSKGRILRASLVPIERSIPALHAHPRENLPRQRAIRRVLQLLR